MELLIEMTRYSFQLSISEFGFVLDRGKSLHEELGISLCIWSLIIKCFHEVTYLCEAEQPNALLMLLFPHLIFYSAAYFLKAVGLLKPFQ